MIRSTIKWIDAGDGHHRGTGTWKVARGTGQYTKITGGGGQEMCGARADAGPGVRTAKASSPPLP